MYKPNQDNIDAIYVKNILDFNSQSIFKNVKHIVNTSHYTPLHTNASAYIWDDIIQISRLLTQLQNKYPNQNYYDWYCTFAGDRSCILAVYLSFNFPANNIYR